MKITLPLILAFKFREKICLTFSNEIYIIDSVMTFYLDTPLVRTPDKSFSADSDHITSMTQTGSRATMSRTASTDQRDTGQEMPVCLRVPDGSYAEGHAKFNKIPRDRITACTLI